MEEDDIQKSVNIYHLMAEKFLLEQGEFYPLGARIDSKGKSKIKFYKSIG